jgi:hypothetical protein
MKEREFLDQLSDYQLLKEDYSDAFYSYVGIFVRYSRSPTLKFCAVDTVLFFI